MAWFDASQIDPAQTQSQFPVGRHPVIIKGSKALPVKDKPNEGLLALTCEIIDGPSKGITGIYRLNLWNGSDQAKDIASKQLSAICHVVGVYGLNDTTNHCSELFGKPFCVIVSQQSADARYTQVDGVTDMNGNPPVRGQAPAPQAQPGPQGAQGQWPVNQPPSYPGTPQPAQQPQAAAPGWPNNAQPQQPAQPAAQPGWGGAPPPNNPAPAQGAAPAWSQQPAGAKPAWG